MMKKRVLVPTMAVFAAFAAGLHAAEKPVAVNCDFEAADPSQGWTLPAKWRIVEGEGRKKSRAMEWENDDPSRFSFPVQHVTLEPGGRYKFGAWVKTMSGKPSPKVCLGWCDATNKWISCTYATAVTDNNAHTDGWTRYEGRTPPLPSNAVKGLLHVHMNRKDTGRVLFDNFTLVAEGGTEMIAYVACSALRNAFTRADGSIRFVAPLYVNTVRHPLKGLKAEFEFLGPDGTMVRRPADRFEADLAEMKCDAVEFACGTQHVALCIRDVATGAILSRKTRRIVHTEKPIRRRVTFDRIGRTIVDGKPFFPLGCFSSRMDDVELKEYRKGPFNFFMPYGTVKRKDMDRYYAAGFMVSPCVMKGVHGVKYTFTSRFKTEAESHAWFRKHVAEVGDHPALLAWFLIDEVPLEFASNVASVNDLLEEIDPDHPTWAVTDKPHHARPLLPCYDIIGMDPYPVGNKGWRNDIGICSSWAREAREGMFDMRPMWQVPQAFNWGWYRKNDTEVPPDLRMPTRQEMANMCWQGIAAGANGLCLFSFSTMRKFLKGAEFDSAWADVCDVAREVKSMERVLLSDGEPMPLAEVSGGGIEARTWNMGGRDWILVVNSTRKPAKARIALPRRFRSLETAVGGGVELKGRDALAADLPGLGYAFVALSPDETWAEELDRSFGIDVARSITKSRDYGMVNGHLSVNVWMDDVAELRRVHAPPYLCEDLKLTMNFNGKSVRTVRSRWRPECVRREGLTADGWRIGTEVRPVDGERSVILSVTVQNTNAAPATMRIGHSFRGLPAYLARWRFSSPRVGLPTLTEGILLYRSGEKPAKVAYTSSFFNIDDVVFQNVPPGESKTCHFAFSLGAGDDVKDMLRRVLADPEATVRRCDDAWRARVKALADRVPRFETDDDGLKRLYTRSLIHFLLCEWNAKEFVVRPFYATGGMFGCCMCCYLWNLGGPYRMMPLVAPEAIKEHLRTFMKLDLEKCYAFNPCDGGPVGPYYPINQEKMIFMIRAYVMETGDVSFLHEKVAGGSVIERVVAMALTHDDLSKPAVLADYGPRNDHLELRKGLPYDGEMPDLNLRRIVLLRLADGLCRIAGHNPGVDLVARANALKRLCRERQWDAAQGWFTGKCSDGKRTTRWTIQMFKALGWGDWVLDADVSAALVKHLMDPDEFLGEYGVHSLAKMDPAYDEWDVDNGGPGACVSFAPAIAERLYADGRASEAATILNRLKWLGDRLPYWSDSHYADRPDYRHNTPLQLNIEGGVISQTIMFGMFGISVRDDFSIEIAPRLPDGTDHIALRGVRLAGRTFDVRCERGKGITVESDGKRHTASLDGRIVLPAVTGR